MNLDAYFDVSLFLSQHSMWPVLHTVTCAGKGGLTPPLTPLLVHHDHDRARKERGQ
jgi:hypothetical protein